MGGVNPSHDVELERTARLPGTTKAVEDVIGQVRHSQKNSQNGAFGRCSRWHAMVQSQVLPDSDRPAIPLTQAARSAARGLDIKGSLFDPLAAEQKERPATPW